MQLAIGPTERSQSFQAQILFPELFHPGFDFELYVIEGALIGDLVHRSDVIGEKPVIVLQVPVEGNLFVGRIKGFPMLVQPCRFLVGHKTTKLGHDDTLVAIQQITDVIGKIQVKGVCST